MNSLMITPGSAAWPRALVQTARPTRMANGRHVACIGMAVISFAAEESLHVGQRFAEAIDFFRRVVEIETGPRAGGNAQSLVERHGTVVAGPDGDALAV